MFSIKISDNNQYIGEVTDSDHVISYSTREYLLESQVIEDAQSWIDWFQNFPSGKTDSIYYILSVPETWVGPPPGSHAYSGLRMKIGRTKHVLRRLQNLQTGTSGQLIIHALEPGGHELEHARHEQFKSDRREGEWFACSPELTEHVFSIWQHYRVLPREHQYKILELLERIKILRAVRQVFDGVPYMVNPSLNEPWTGKVLIDLIHKTW